MDIYPGRIVVSTAGRDKDRYFVVLSVYGEYCYLSDGKVRKVDMPKKKKIKHLRVTEFFLEEIAEMLDAEQTVTNSKIKRAIRLGTLR
ncbi:MAG: KOW domain-containing RNA-binding protein [Clostridia bacterium]|nr:KOW domain-containing RNA-binding protein [Clostridia bacterium]